MPHLLPGQVVVLDNLPAHKSPKVDALIESAGARVLRLPPYSPDFNPIEMAISKIKSILRKLARRTVDALLARDRRGGRRRHRRRRPRLHPALRLRRYGGSEKRSNCDNRHLAAAFQSLGAHSLQHLLRGVERGTRSGTRSLNPPADPEPAATTLRRRRRRARRVAGRAAKAAAGAPDGTGRGRTCSRWRGGPGTTRR